jgi:hypothetical protein
MANSLLQGTKYKIPKNILKYIKGIVLSFNGNKRTEGYQRLKNLNDSGFISYEELKRIKNFFDTYNGNEPEIYEMNGGDVLNKWVNQTLDFLREKTKLSKKVKSELSTKNEYRNSNNINSIKNNLKKDIENSINNGIYNNEGVIYINNSKKLLNNITENKKILNAITIYTDNNN